MSSAILSISISLVYVFLVTAAIDKTIKDEDRKREIRKKLMVAITLGVVSVLAGIFINNPSAIGIALGGLFLIIFGLFTGWTDFGENEKIIILGVAFVFLVGIAMNFNKLSNLKFM